MDHIWVFKQTKILTSQKFKQIQPNKQQQQPIFLTPNLSKKMEEKKKEWKTLMTP